MTKNKIKKEPATFRLRTDTIESLKIQANNGVHSQAEIIQKALDTVFSGNDTDNLKARLQAANEKLQEQNSIIERYEKQTGKKIIGTRRITAFVTEAELIEYGKICHFLKTSKRNGLSKILLVIKSQNESILSKVLITNSQSELPRLESNLI